MDRGRDGGDGPRTPTLIRHIKRLYKSDMDVRTALKGVGVCLVGGIGVSLLSPLASLSFFGSLGLILSLVLVWSKRSGVNAAIALQAALLGFVGGCCIVASLASTSPHSRIFSVYLLVVTIFHYTEFIFTALTNRRALQADSFLLNHSWAYWMAALLAWIEFWVESYFFPSMKGGWFLVYGLILCTIGELLRKGAMVHAGVAFTHRLALSKRPDHRLVTSGIYSWVRHPGYVGWFLWSAGTQVMLANPICLIAYVIVTWNFFNERIEDEERDLLFFFGRAYIDYQERVPSGIPFVTGYCR